MEKYANKKSKFSNWRFGKNWKKFDECSERLHICKKALEVCGANRIIDVKKVEGYKYSCHKKEVQVYSRLKMVNAIFATELDFHSKTSFKERIRNGNRKNCYGIAK